MNPRRLFRSRCGGQSLVEFTLVGIPMIFVLIGTFEISRGMWMFHTLAHAVRDGVRYATVHGYNCTNNNNSCTVTMNQVAAVIRSAAVGLDPSSTKLNFYTFPTGSTTKTPTGSQCTLDTSTNPCSTTNTFPPPACNTPKACQVEIDITTPFNSALALLWPGANPVSFASGTLGATSVDAVQY
jgi:Flp pilus assembly protein TadG